MESKAITGKTKICGVIGDPIEHTMSPVMHNAAFKKLGIDYVYLPFRVGKEELNEAIAGMRALNIRGFNVTIPHKVAIIPLLDKLDLLAERIGAVNTVVNDDGILSGYNTDGTGFLQSMLEHGIEPKEKNIVILGAGGASRALSFTLAERGGNLVILNRLLEFEWAEELAQKLAHTFKREVKALKLDERNLSKALEGADILINATSMGMSPDVDETLVSRKLLRPDLVVFDIVYNPIRTRLLREAEEAGAMTVGGLNMLVWQGIMSFEKWTGQKPPFELMREEAARVLEGHEE